MKKILQIPLAIITILILNSCSSHLSRDNAEKAIIENDNLPYNVEHEFNLTQATEYRAVIPYNAEYFNGGDIGGDIRLVSYGYTLPETTNEIIKTTTNPKRIEAFDQMEGKGLVNYSMDISRVFCYDKPYGTMKKVKGKGKYFVTFEETYTTIPVVVQVSHIANLTDEGKKYISGNNLQVATMEFGEITGIVEREGINEAEVNYTVVRKNITPFGQIFNINEETINKTVFFEKFDDGWRIRE